MPNFPLVLDYANLFCGAAPTDDNASNHLVLSSVKLPAWEVQYVDHRAGGAPMAIEIDVIMSRLDLEFEVVGVTPQIMVLLKTFEISKTVFHVYGHIRSYLTGSSSQLYARFRGQLGKVDPAPFRRGDIWHVKYHVRGMTAYELQIADQTLCRWDFFSNEFFVSDFSDLPRFEGDPGAGPG